MSTRHPGPVIMDLAGTQLTAEERELVMHPLVGGVILFSRNYDNPAQLAELIFSLRQLRSPLLITVDQEGGRVQRLRHGFTELPPMAALGRRFDADPAQARAEAQELGWLLAAELRDLDIDLSFAPVLDVAGNAEVIGDRAFHREPAAVVELAVAFIGGMREAGMAAVGKHFPGHGSVGGDSHVMLPLDTRSAEQIEHHDLLAFAQLAHEDIPGLMSAHVVYPTVDDVPATFSRIWLRQILRERIGYDGMIISDDLNMAAAAQLGDARVRAAAALDAGCELLPICNDRHALVTVLDQVRWQAGRHFRRRYDRLLGARRPGADPGRRTQARELADLLAQPAAHA